MTPAIEIAKKAKISVTVHTYTHDPENRHYGTEAAEKLALSPDRVFKTLVVETPDRKLAVCVLPVSGQLDLKQVSDLLQAKRVEMADQRIAENATGYLSGGISPLMRKKQFPTLLDRSALNFETVFVSGGRRGVEMELSPHDLQRLTKAVCATITR